MASSSDLNLILGQSPAIKEVHNTKKQNMELNQHFLTQSMEDRKKEERSEVQGSEKGDTVTLKKDEEKKDENQKKNRKEDRKRKPSEEEQHLSEGTLIDITV